MIKSISNERENVIQLTCLSIDKNGGWSTEPTFRNFPSPTNFLRGAWIGEFTVDLGELSVLSVVRFWPFGSTFLHNGGGATLDNCKEQEQNMSFIWKGKMDIKHILTKEHTHTYIHIYCWKKPKFHIG